MRSLKIGLVLLVVLASVGHAARLEGARYANRIPLYPDARFESSMGGSSSVSKSGAVSRSTAWIFKSSDSAEQVCRFYQAHLEKASRSQAGSETLFFLVPEGARSIQEGRKENITVRVRPQGGATTIQITEVLSLNSEGRSGWFLTPGRD